MAESHPGPEITLDELRLAARNHAMPLEALRYDVTPTGLHYLLIHYDIPAVDADAWRLEVLGSVDRPLSLSYDDIRGRAPVTEPVTFECAGNGRALLSPRPISQPWLSEAIGTGSWTGTPLAPLLQEAGVLDGAVEVVFTGLDRGVEGGEEQYYERSLPVADAMRPEVLLVWDLNGAPLPPQHGFPLRLIVPGWYGMTNVKWLTRITVTEEPFTGYQNEKGYRYRETEDEPGRPITRMQPRALMVPPGIPDFMTRTRHVRAGPVLLTGRAWSGHGPIEGVEVSVDAGRSWTQATLDTGVGAWAWKGWSHTWDATPGEHVLCCRAVDAAGHAQPAEPSWNVGGYANNAAQRVDVIVDG